ncbi:MAG: M20/M25/M40 family metallo-hydrolase [Vicinamibacterales bacterium]
MDARAAPFPVSLSNAPVVFAGYGISAPGLGYDDFAGIDVTGAAVIVLTHEPQEADPQSVFDGRNLTPGAALAAKAHAAREHGARMLLVVEDPSHATDRTMRPGWWSDPQSEPMGIPVVRVGRDRLEQALPALALEETARQIDRRLRPASRALAGVRVEYVERRAQFVARLRNVVGMLRGADAARAEDVVVVGAHYDHVGRGGAFSDAPESTGEIHNGADDNASGVAVLLEVARAAGRTRSRFRRSLVFAAFAGEELGLRGSAHYAEAPPVPLSRTSAMVDLDMVGRARGRVMVGVFDRAGRLGAIRPRLARWTQLTVQDFTHGGYEEAQSDGAAFSARGVPVIAFFTGFHADYHRPSDDWPRIDAEGGAAIARLTLRLLEELAR